MTTPVVSMSTTTPDRGFSLKSWIEPRRASLMTIGLGMMTWPLVFGMAWRLWPASRAVASADRVGYALELIVAPAIVLLSMILSCMRLMDNAGAENPFAGLESDRFKINQRVVTNTLEQGAVFVPLLLGLSMRLPSEHLKVMPIAVTIWCVGRLLFWAGYHVAPHWRAPGFDWTLLTTTLLAGWFAYTLF